MTVILVTGIQAAGKSTVAQALADRLDRRRALPDHPHGLRRRVWTERQLG